MNAQLKLFLAILSTLILLLASVFTALAGGPHWQAAAGNLVGTDDGARVPAQAKCTKMEISNPSLWFATDKEGNVYADKIVKQYPDGTSYIAAGFEYNCIPKNTTVTVVYYYGGFDTEPVFTDSSKEKATNEGGTFWWYIGYDDGTPIPEGDWQVEWYINKKLASQGEITVGGGTKEDVEDIGDETGDDEESTSIDDIWNWGDEEGEDQAATVTVQGTIVDGKTKKPIAGAMFIVLNPGVGAQEWVDAKFPTEDVFSAGQTDTKGKFVLSQPLERNVTYTVFVVAKGYQPIVAEDFMIDDQQEDPVDLTIKMYK